MAIPKWDKNKYSIHNEVIDAEHKKLFDIAERAGILVNKQANGDEIKKILAELFEYMKVHFHDEEAYMASINYPGLEKQKESHHQIIQEMTSLIQNIRYDFKQKLAIVTEQWLIEHILKEDMLIEEYRKNHEEEIRQFQASHQNIKQKVEYLYKCGCDNKTFKVLNTVHEKIQNGQVFHCKKCGKVIEFVKIELKNE